MKRFSFRLDRVLEWRHTQARLEEAKLEKLHAELRLIDTREAMLKEERDREERALMRRGTTSGSELAALESYRASLTVQFAKLHQARVECSNRVAAQIRQVADRKRDARLLERLRERQFGAWRNQADREESLHADESYLFRFRNATQ